jgi:ubiquinone biosynthesis protein
MISSFRHFARLSRTAFLLARYDVLLPREFTDEMPSGTRRGTKLLGALARATAGRKAKTQDLETRISNALVTLGPAYVKFGQVMATRGDIVGPRLAGALSVLQDRLAPFSSEDARAIIEKELGKPIDALFLSLSEPVAAASVAQVHRGEIEQDGQTQIVAVKVLRPGIETVFSRDLQAFAWAAKWIHRLFPKARRLEPQLFVQVLADSVKLEMDLRTEAAAASELGENIASQPDFKVPRVDWDRTTRRVLTTTWIDGISLRDEEGLKDAGFDMEALGTLVVRSFMTQALMDGFFHADMHPGNLFAFNASKGGGNVVPGIAAVDFGIMGRLDEKTRNYLADILWGFLVGDYDGIAVAHIDAGYVPQGVPMKDFAMALRAIGEPLLGRTADQIPMARLLQQLMGTTERFDMHLQPQLVLLQKTMVVVEGVARDLSPGYDMWETARPVVERFMRDMRGPEAALRDVAEGAKSLLTTLKRAPALLEEGAQRLEALGEMTDDGLRLHPDTIETLANLEAEKTRRGRRWWLFGGAAAALALLVHLA